MLFHRKFIFESIWLCWFFNTLKYKIANFLKTKMICCNLQETLSLFVAEVTFSSPQNGLQLLEPMSTSPAITAHNRNSYSQHSTMGYGLGKILCWSLTVWRLYVLPCWMNSHLLKIRMTILFFFFFKLYKIVLLFLYLGLVMLHKATENFI